MRHYFVKTINTGDTLILCGGDNIIRNGWVAFTEEQEEYYKEHPSATIWEIKNLTSLDSGNVHANTTTSEKETDTTIEEQPSLSDVKKQAIEEMSERSLNTRRKFVPDYKIINAQATIYLNDEIEGIYSLDDAQSIFNDYVTYSKICRELYYEFVSEIDKATTIKDINDILNCYVNRYNDVK